MPLDLDALGVVIVLLGAGRSASASSSTRETLTTALSVLLSSHGSRASLMGWCGLGHGGESSSSWGCGRGDRSRSSRGSGLSGSGWGATGCGCTAPELGSNAWVGGEGAVDVEENTGVSGLVGTWEGDTFLYR
jgi:hypothetical protein